MTTYESSTYLTVIGTLSNVDSSMVSDDNGHQSCISARDMNSSEKPLPDVVSRNTMNDEPEDHYDTIGSLGRDYSRYTISMTSEDNCSGQSLAPYMTVRHLQQSVAQPLAPGSRQLSRKRCLLVGIVATVIIALLAALASVTAVLVTYNAEQNKGEDFTPPTSQSSFTPSTTMNVSTVSTSVSSTTPSLPPSTTPSATTSASTTPTDCMRKCISCTSNNLRCPANGAIIEGDPGEVMPCPCHTACFSDVRYDDGSTVHRGCTGDYPAWDAASSVDLTCREIGRHFLCFCLGDRCNKDDMTSHFP